LTLPGSLARLRGLGFEVTQNLIAGSGALTARQDSDGDRSRTIDTTVQRMIRPSQRLRD